MINLRAFMRIGFTGTRFGMTIEQEQCIINAVASVKSEGNLGHGLKRLEFHHGVCVGSDEKFHKIVVKAGFGDNIIKHPPINDYLMSKTCIEGIFLEPKPFLERDDDVIKAVEIMLATPHEEYEIMRSGTWATIRHARKKKKPIFIIFPNGEVSIQS